MTQLLEHKLEHAVNSIRESEHPFVSPLGPLIIASAALGIADNSLSFARKFDIEHAFVIRECNALESELSLIEFKKKRQQSQRLYYQLTEKAWLMIPTELVD